MAHVQLDSRLTDCGKDGTRKVNGTSALRQQLKNNANITLTAEDYVTIGIHIDKTTRTPSPLPTIAPINILLDTRHLVKSNLLGYAAAR